MGFHRSISVMLVVGLGCAVEPDEGVVTAEAGCSRGGCNENSPWIAGAPFFELRRTGPNSHPLQLTVMGIWSAAGQQYTLDVRRQTAPGSGSRLVGLNTPGGSVVLDTPGMTNAVIKLRDRSMEVWELRIRGVAFTPFWARPYGYVVPTYLVTVHRPGDPDYVEFDLCSNPPPQSLWAGGNPRHMVFFDGDRYDPNDGTVLATGSPATDGWFNASCAGSAPFKLYLNRFTETTGNPALRPTTRMERQAMLKAYTSTICSGGGAFTGLGEPLHIYDWGNVVIDPSPLDWTRLEGLWGPGGAYCIEDHRLNVARSMSQAAADKLIDIELPNTCGTPPLCSVRYPGMTASNWKLFGMVLTTNPP